MIKSFRSQPIPPGRNPPSFPSASFLACSRAPKTSSLMRPTSENVDSLTRVSLICARFPILLCSTDAGALLPVYRGSHTRRTSIPTPARRLRRHWRSIRTSHLFILSCRSSATITTFRDREIHARTGPVAAVVPASPRRMTDYPSETLELTRHAIRRSSPCRTSRDAPSAPPSPPSRHQRRY